MAAKAGSGVWGIDLGQCALKALRVEVIDGEVTATAFDYIEYPKILSQPDADPDELTREALNKFLSRNHLRGDQVVISVPGQSGLARFVKLPPVEEKKISEIVKFEAKQQIPFPLEEVVWDYQKLGSGEVLEGLCLETEIGLFAMKRDMVNRYLQHFKDVKVEIHHVQMAPLALCNFVAHDLLNKGAEGGGASEEEDTSEDDDSAGKKKCVVALDIGTDNSNLVITDGERIIWQRPIPIGGNHFTRALTKDLKLTFAKAEHLKRNAMKSPDLKKILGSLRPVLNDFVSEVQRSLGYFTNTHRDAHIKYMIGLGNAFRLPGLQKFLQEKLQIDVRKLQKIRRLEGSSVTAAPQFTENILSFAVAEGLALQGLKLARIQTNLLPSEIHFERMVRAKKPYAVAVAALLLAAIAFLGIARAVEHTAQSDPAIKKNLADAKKVMGEAETFNNEESKVLTDTKNTRETVLRVAAGVHERFNWNLFYKYINDALPTLDGKHLADTSRTRGEVKSFYFKDDNKGDGGPAALRLLMKRRLDLAKERQESNEDRKTDEKIKLNLVSISIEGVAQMYSDDLKPFVEYVRGRFPNLDKSETEKSTAIELLRRGGMSKEDARRLIKEPEKIKEAGWVVEIRGYTYHKRGEEFVIKTLVENLANPNGVFPSLFPPNKSHERQADADKKAFEAWEKRLTPKGGKSPALAPMNTQVADRIRFVFLDKSIPDRNPEGADFYIIKQSGLKTVLGGEGGEGKVGLPKMGKKGEGEGTPQTPATPGREGWSVIGEVARDALGSGTGPGGIKGGIPGGNKGGFGVKGFGQKEVPGGEKGGSTETFTKTTRTEFVIYFVWLEPLTPEATAGQPKQ